MWKIHGNQGGSWPEPGVPVRRTSDAGLFVLWIISLFTFRLPLAALIELALRDDRYTYIVLIPFISAFLIWLARERILQESTPLPRSRSLLLVAGIMLFSASIPRLAIDPDWDLPLAILAMVLVWVGIGVFCYGVRALSLVVFPLLFLFLMIPIPASIMDKLVIALQKESADLTAALFRLSGMPFSRDGLRFSLQTQDIEIGKECSGIRSAASLCIGGILMSYTFLRSGWSRIGFVLLTIPVVVFKNAVRIATISWLGIYVDGAFFAGNLHHFGGLLFSPLAVAILLPILVGLKKIEGDLNRQAAA